MRASRDALQAIMHYSDEEISGNRDLVHRNREDFLTLLSNALPIGVIGGYCEDDFPLYFVSREMYRMMGYSSYHEFETAIQGKVSNTIYYEDLERVSKDLGSDYHAGGIFGTYPGAAEHHRRLLRPGTAYRR